MPDVEPITAALLLSDFVESINGKLYIQGGGWSRIRAARPMTLGIGMVVHVPYSHTNQKHTLGIVLVTEDGAPYPTPPQAPMPFTATTTFEVGRPPGMRPGEQSNVAVAIMVGGIQFEPGGYRVEVRLDNDDDLLASAPFRAIEG